MYLPINENNSNKPKDLAEQISRSTSNTAINLWPIHAQIWTYVDHNTARKSNPHIADFSCSSTGNKVQMESHLVSGILKEKIYFFRQLPGSSGFEVGRSCVSGLSRLEWVMSRFVSSFFREQYTP